MNENFIYYNYTRLYGSDGRQQYSKYRKYNIVVKLNVDIYFKEKNKSQIRGIPFLPKFSIPLLKVSIHAPCIKKNPSK